MRYIDVEWIHNLEDEPIRLVSEIGDDEFEMRKLEFFRDGSVGYSSEMKSSKNTKLGICEVPSIEEIISQKEFSGCLITSEQFEKLWAEFGHGIA